MKRPRTPKDTAQRYNLNYRIARLTAVLENLKRLYDSEQKYAVRRESRNGVGYTTYDSAIQTIVFHIGAMNAASFVHETTHGIQFEQGKMIFHNDLAGFGIGDDLDDELEAYKNQLSLQFSPSLIYNICDSVSATWLFRLKDSIGQYVYNVRPGYLNEKNSVIGLIPIGINSTGDELRRAFPMLDTIWRTDHPLQDTKLFYFKRMNTDTSLLHR